jgi:hypothetical protein
MSETTPLTEDQELTLVRSTAISNCLIPVFKAEQSHDVVLVLESLVISDKIHDAVVAWVVENEDINKNKQLVYKLISAYSALDNEIKEVGLDIRFYKPAEPTEIHNSDETGKTQTPQYL